MNDKPDFLRIEAGRRMKACDDIWFNWRNDPSYDWAQQVKDKRSSKLPNTGAAWKGTEIAPIKE